MAERVERWAAERRRLTGLCAHLTGDIDSAEDLAQETLIEAWSHEASLRDPTRHAEWLSGIARNVCRRWVRRRGRDIGRVRPSADEDDQDNRIEARDLLDLEVELERKELADLLDRALALLPEETSRILVERFVGGSPHAEIAARFGLSEGAVKVRVHRGKLALRRILTTDLLHQAVAHGLVGPAGGGWVETDVFCPYCGRHRMQGKYLRSEGTLTLHCPHCSAYGVNVVHIQMPDLLSGSSSYLQALDRTMAFAAEYVGAALRDGQATCLQCGTAGPLRLGLPREADSLPGRPHGVHFRCAGCGDLWWSTLSTMALCLPEGRAFWRKHRRIETLPEDELAGAGGAALVARLASVEGAERLDVVYTRETLQLIQVHAPAS
jgi:RNA polymerase sigma factor (sigma-70 family)